MNLGAAHSLATETGNDWPRVGAFSYDFKRGEWMRLVESFKRYGLRTVQIGHELLDEVLEDPAAIPTVRRSLVVNGITVAGVAGYRNLVAPDPAKRTENIAFLKRCLEVAPLLGRAVVATETGTRHPVSDWLPSLDNISMEA